MMNVALLDHESSVARESSAAVAAPGEISLSHKIDSVRELAAVLLKRIEELEETLSSRGATRGVSLHDEVQRFETEIICDALKKTGGHQRRAARLLGVKVSTLNAKIKRYRIQPEEVAGLSNLHRIGDKRNA